MVGWEWNQSNDINTTYSFTFYFSMSFKFFNSQFGLGERCCCTCIYLYTKEFATTLPRNTTCRRMDVELYSLNILGGKNARLAEFPPPPPSQGWMDGCLTLKNSHCTIPAFKNPSRDAPCGFCLGSRCPFKSSFK
jgi:hypothetical protein